MKIARIEKEGTWFLLPFLQADCPVSPGVSGGWGSGPETPVRAGDGREISQEDYDPEPPVLVLWCQLQPGLCGGRKGWPGVHRCHLVREQGGFQLRGTVGGGVNTAGIWITPEAGISLLGGCFGQRLWW